MWKACVLIAVAGFLVSCAAPPFTGAEPREKVLIATEKSDFKNAVVAGITQRLEQARCTYRVVELNDLRWYTSEAHEAVVMLHSVWGWRLSGPVADFLDRTPQAQWYRIVVVSTARGEDWQPKQKSINAITSASSPDRVDAIAG